jgi:MFS family permease
LQRCYAWAYLILGAVLAASVVSFVTIPLSGHISDRIGRKKMYLIGAATTGVFGFLYFGMVDTAAPVTVFVAIVLSLIPHDMQYGPQAALIATALFASFHSGYAISIYIAACAVVSLVATAMMPDYTGKDISMEYDD